MFMLRFDMRAPSEGPAEIGDLYDAAVEMSVTQAIVPHLVHPELAPDVAESGGPRLGSLRLLAAPAAQIPSHGYHGCPSEIEHDHGRVLLDRAADRIVASLDALLSHCGCR